MTKEKLSLLEFTSKVHKYMRDKALEVGFVFTMRDRSGLEWYLHTRELNECTDTAFKEATPESLKEWENLKKSFESEAIEQLNKIYDIQKFDKYGMPIK